MLSLEQGVIDGTTPEGRAQIEELERLARERKLAEEQGRVEGIEEGEEEEEDDGDLPVEGEHGKST